MRKSQFEQIMESINNINSRISVLEEKVNETPKTKKATTKKTTKTTAKKTAPKTEKETKTETTKITDFEPCKFKDSGNYVWGGVRGYKAMRSAYCYAKQTDGKARNLEEANKLGYKIDFDKKWKADKAAYEKKYVYVKASDR